LDETKEPRAALETPTLRRLDARQWFRPLDDDQGSASLDAILGKRMARPKKQDGEKRSEQTKERWTPAELEYLNDQAAARAGLFRAEYIRLRALAYSLRPAPHSSADPALIVALNRVGNNVNQLARSVHRGSDFQRYWQEVGSELRAVLAKSL
jgi:hypothetical protein